MLKNCVFKVSVDNRKWLKAAGIRAVKTVAQAAIAGIGTAAALGQVDWKYVLIRSLLLPEKLWKERRRSSAEKLCV